jgi:hypothetical protein
MTTIKDFEMKNQIFLYPSSAPTCAVSIPFTSYVDVVIVVVIVIVVVVVVMSNLLSFRRKKTKNMLFSVKSNHQTFLSLTHSLYSLFSFNFEIFVFQNFRNSFIHSFHFIRLYRTHAPHPHPLNYK